MNLKFYFVMFLIIRLNFIYFPLPKGQILGINNFKLKSMPKNT